MGFVNLKSKDYMISFVYASIYKIECFKFLSFYFALGKGKKKNNTGEEERSDCVGNGNFGEGRKV